MHSFISNPFLLFENRVGSREFLINDPISRRLYLGEDSKCERHPFSRRDRNREWAWFTRVAIFTTSNFMITVRRISGDEYEVVVNSATPTTHRVTITEPEHARLAGSGVSAERLIEESFCFLLEREPNTSILRTFQLPVISRYFPEYEPEIRERLRAD